jgi:hypothetical protein
MFTVTKAGLIPMPINLCKGCIGAARVNLRCARPVVRFCEENHGEINEKRGEKEGQRQVGARGKPEQQRY